ncbi:MAG: hypothetical protein K0S71_2868 [Clostridia bacterium]|jgi:uncharacterized hydrophobic protein (TIGR00271 family)|nr:hypothetical protein [Clostridia bacterium]
MINNQKKSGFITSFRKILVSSFRLDTDKASNDEIHDTIQSASHIQGPNMIILILAIFIASIGLNMNSTAIIIGAMLISPLMGCIMAIGYGLATNDLKFVRKAFLGLAFQVLVCIITSTIYFKLTPISTARSEILSRTTPTIWDVLIATFGGIAGIIGVTRKEKSNIIPGVAIATALMPPLCTAGYGIAMGSHKYFFGAFYLFFINSFFICVSTFILIRMMRLPKKAYIDKHAQLRVKFSIYLIGIVTILPSIYLGYGIVKDSLTESNVNSFINKEFIFANTRLLNKYIDYPKKTLEVVVFGSKLSEETIDFLNTKLSQYNLEDLTLKVTQTETPDSLGQEDVKRLIDQELYESNQVALGDRDKKIELLENELLKYKLSDFDVKALYHEIKTLYPGITDLSIGKNKSYNPFDEKIHEVTIATINVYKELPSEDVDKITKWLEARINQPDIYVYTNFTVPLAPPEPIEEIIQSEEPASESLQAEIIH